MKNGYLLQIEVHPHYKQSKLLDYCRQRGKELSSFNRCIFCFSLDCLKVKYRAVRRCF